MRFAYFPGCKIPYHLPQHGLAVEAVCRALGIELVPLEFNCCGYPVRHQSFEASMYSAARNFALAHQARLPILTPCKCCFGNQRHAAYWLGRNDRLRDTVQGMLRKEGLALPPREVEVVHLLTALDREVGAGKIRKQVIRPLVLLKVAAHYGCHALRPSEVTRFDNPLSPTLFERLVRATGATCVDWPMRLECCGNPLWDKDDTTARRLMRKKLKDARDAGADVVCTSCTYCQLQFDTLRHVLPQGDPLHHALPSILYPQLLGVALGLAPEDVGLDRNVTPFPLTP